LVVHSLRGRAGGQRGELAVRQGAGAPGGQAGLALGAGAVAPGGGHSGERGGSLLRGGAALGLARRPRPLPPARRPGVAAAGAVTRLLVRRSGAVTAPAV